MKWLILILVGLNLAVQYRLWVGPRSLADVRGMVDVDGLLYAGNHGLEIKGPGVDDFLHEDLAHYRPRLAALARQIEEISTPGSWVEEKGASLTFHYRGADETQHPRLASDARGLIRSAGFQARW